MKWLGIDFEINSVPPAPICIILYYQLQRYIIIIYIYIIVAGGIISRDLLLLYVLVEKMFIK